jgi:hypothetical protein
MLLRVNEIRQDKEISTSEEAHRGRNESRGMFGVRGNVSIVPPHWMTWGCVEKVACSCGPYLNFKLGVAMSRNVDRSTTYKGVSETLRDIMR